MFDGGFDAQGSTVSDYCYLPACPSGPWSSPTGNGGFIREGTAIWGSPAPISPHTIGFVQSAGVGLQRTFTVPQSGTYSVSGWLAGRPSSNNWAGNQTITVSINGTAVGQMTTTSSSPWAKFRTSSFAAAAGQSYTIQFAGSSASDNTSFIDGVFIYQSVQYSYDALGRVTSVVTTGGPGDGVATGYALDAAGNRTRVITTGVK